MDCREGEPVGEFIRLQIREGKYDERGQQGRAGVYGTVVDGVPHLLQRVIALDLSALWLVVDCILLTVLPAWCSSAFLSVFLYSSMVLTFLIIPSAL